ncbi:MAG: GntP family permease [Actinomycetaceae bacterium]|nr:GntP family permease [Actinomycetaceae bacterium]
MNRWRLSMVLPVEIEGWEQTLTTGPLLGIAVAAVAVILVLIIGFRLHAFLTLVLVSLLTAFAAGIPAGSVLSVMSSGFNGTIGDVALIVGLGAMLGKLVEASGGAKILADAMINTFGEQRAPLALGVASLFLGFPIFFDAGLVVMLPVVFAVAHRLKGNVVLYAIPTVAAFSTMHVFAPPHPGPVGAATALGANMGLVLLIGVVVALPTFYISGILWGRWISQHVEVRLPKLFGSVKDDDLPDKLPSVGIIIFTIVLPAIIVMFNTGLNALVQAQILEGVEKTNSYGLSEYHATSPLVNTFVTLGQSKVALLISVLVALVILGRYIAKDKIRLEKVLDSSIGPVASVILITGAGGMFGGVLREAGIGKALQTSLADLGIPVILATYLIAVLLRLAQGSATAALMITAGLVAPMVTDAHLSALGIACIVLAASAGSVFGSHVNDSGFWLVGRLTGMDVKTTLKVWTMQQTIQSFVGFIFVAIIYMFS